MALLSRDGSVTKSSRRHLSHRRARRAVRQRHVHAQGLSRRVLRATAAV